VGLILFVILISSLIMKNIRSVLVMKTTDVASEETGDGYFDDLETL